MPNTPLMPPTHAFLLDEPRLRRVDDSTLAGLVDDPGFLRALRNAAVRSADPDHFQYVDANADQTATDLVITPTGSLDPFSLGYACSSVICSLDRARQFGRLVALYSDYAILPDAITATAAKSDLLQPPIRADLLRELAIVQELRPLIEAGLLRFGVPFPFFCANCNPGLQERLDRIIQSTATEWLPRVKASHANGAVDIDLKGVWGPGAPIHRRILGESAGSDTATQVSDFYVSIIRDYITERLINCRSAVYRSSLLISHEHVDAVTIQRIVGDIVPGDRPRDLSNLASVELPWISKLNLSEALCLRDAASEALPRLRERLALRLLRANGDDAASHAEAIQELRSEAEEVRAELTALGARHQRFFDDLIGGLALTVSVGGLATGMVTASLALAGLLGALGSLHSSQSRRATAEASLRAKPAFALVKARDILEQRRH